MQTSACMHAQEQTPKEQDRAVRQQVLDSVNQVVGKGLAGFTDLHVEPYGSFVSGLYTPGGDLDIAIENSVVGRYAPAAATPTGLCAQESHCALWAA